MSDDDTVRQFPQSDLEPKDNLQVVPVSKLPLKIRETLENEDLYQGWQDSIIYFDKNTELFLVPVKSREGIKTYGLNENGKPVTFSEVTKPDKN